MDLDRTIGGNSAADPLHACPPVAIIGMSCRFPGASSVTDFWDLVQRGDDAISEVPSDRYDRAAADLRGRAPPWGGFISGVDLFDAEFFGISPREAKLMDPQQRLLLEVAYEALEDGGYSPSRLARREVGCFVGQIGGDYWHLQLRGPDPVEFYGLTGAASRAITANRLSFVLDLGGPSITVDTACASSLTAVHLAVQSLRAQECDLALAGAVNLILLPQEGAAYWEAGMLAEDGRCKFGSATADGFVRSDGIGTLLLKPLDAAERDGDRVRAVIRGSAVGSDGRSSGYLATPSAEGQRRVLERAYRVAGVDPAGVDYIEAHGTGTVSGDPVELEALAAVLGPGRDPDRPCLVGSVKTNIGHTEAAAGIAGLIKTVLVLEHDVIPPSRHRSDLTPDVPWEEIPLRIPARPVPVDVHGRLPVAGVNSFGIGGTNSHVVLSAAVRSHSRELPAPGEPHLLTLAAASPEALLAQARTFLDYLRPGGQGAQRRFVDICYSASVCREHRESRLALAASSHQEAVSQLERFLSGDATGLHSGEALEGGAPRLAFVFPGQGSQWPGMARELYASEPVFRATLDRCDRAIFGETGSSLLELLHSQEPDSLQGSHIVQPVLWAMEVALVALWRSWGVEPDLVIGHSMGEAAAAYVSGALPFADAAAVICRRSALVATQAGRGAMAWVELPAEEAAGYLDGAADRVSVAAVNSPSSTLLSGDREALTRVLEKLDQQDVFHRWVKVDYASHSPHMDELGPQLRDQLEEIVPRRSRIPMISTLLAAGLGGQEMTAGYWARNLREPVNLLAAVRQAISQDTTVFVEVSPHPLLTGDIVETGSDSGVPVLAVGSLRRDESERGALLGSLGQLYTRGVAIHWEQVHAGGDYVPLPHYPWQRDSYWLAGTEETVPAPAHARSRPAPHPFLQTVTESTETARVWQSPLSLETHPYLRGHRVEGTVILPGTAYLDIAASAAQELLVDRPVVTHDVEYHRAIFLDDGPSLTLQVAAERSTSDRFRIGISTQVSGDPVWTLHCEASVSVRDGDTAPAPPGESIEAVAARCPAHERGAEIYTRHALAGNEWRGAFQGLKEVWRGTGEALGLVECPRELLPDLEAYLFHPALLDAAGHSLLAVRPLIPGTEAELFVAGSVDQVTFHRRATPRLWAHARDLPSDRHDSLRGDLTVYTEDGEMAVELRGFRLRLLNSAAQRLPASTATAVLNEGPST